MARMAGEERLQERLKKANEKVEDLQKRLDAAKAEKKEIEEQIKKAKINAVIELLDEKNLTIDDLRKLITEK